MIGRKQARNARLARLGVCSCFLIGCFSACWLLFFTRPFLPQERICTSTSSSIFASLTRNKENLRCAVVGSAGFLRNQRLGHLIDGHDLVIRSNLAPVAGFEEIVGSKTNLRVLNSEALGALLTEKLCFSNSSCPKYPVFLNSNSQNHIDLFRAKCPTTPVASHEDIGYDHPVVRALWPGLFSNVMSGAWSVALASSLCGGGTTLFGITHAGTMNLHSESYHYFDSRPSSPVDSLSASAVALSRLAAHQPECLSLHTPSEEQLSNNTFTRSSSANRLVDKLVDDVRHKKTVEYYMSDIIC